MIDFLLKPEHDVKWFQEKLQGKIADKQGRAIPLLVNKLIGDEDERRNWLENNLLKVANEETISLISQLQNNEEGKNILSGNYYMKSTSLSKQLHKNEGCEYASSNNSSFRLIHIGDLHYTCSNVEENDQERRMKSMIKELKNIQNEQSVSALLFSGDIAANKPADDMTACGRKLDELFAVFGFGDNKEYVFFVPGNHDVSWNDFDNGIPASQPYMSYVTMLEKVLSKAELEKHVGYDRSGNEIPFDVGSDDLIWRRQLKMPQLDIIGISTVSTQKDEKGIGVISNNCIDYIRNEWGGAKRNDEIRILLMHHNLFSVLSYSNKDEKRITKNAGACLKALTQCGCDLVISGHTHRGEVTIYSTSALNNDGYNAKMTQVISISAGTSGGVVPTGDFARSFNVIDISIFNIESRCSIDITPYLYDSANDSWNCSNKVALYL